MAVDRAPLLDRRFLDALDALEAVRRSISTQRSAPDRGSRRAPRSIAQVLIAQRWRGLGDRADFLAMQASERPIVLAMQRADQRARVVASPGVTSS